MRKLILVLIIVVAAGCESISDNGSAVATPYPAAIAYRATEIYASADTQLSIAQQQAAQADADYRATVAASEQYAATKTAVQATLDASYIAEAQARANAARAAADVEAGNVQLKSLEIVSATFALTTTQALRAQEFDKQTTQNTGPLYQVTDFIVYVFPRFAIFIGLPIILCLILLRVSGTLIGWLQKKVEVNGVTYILAEDGPVALIPPPREEWEIDQENTGETGNTETLVNTGDSAVTQDNTEDLISVDRGTAQPMLRMTSEERAEFQAVRHDAIALLARCVDYYKANPGAIDDGTIPRYDKLRMKPEYRGNIVDNLEYSGLASKTKNRSAVVPEIGSCSVLMRLIVDNRKRVYPVGYHERKQEKLANAVLALPVRQNIEGIL